MKAFVAMALRAAGAACLVAAAAALWSPPPYQAPGLPSAGDPLLGRLFPGVPSGWVAARLVLVLAGALALAAASGRGGADAAAGEDEGARSGEDPVRAVALAAVVLAAASAASFHLPHAAQLLLIAAFFAAPAAVLAQRLGRAGELLPALGRGAGLAAGPTALALAWLAWRLPPAFGSPLLADAIDYLATYSCFETAAHDAFAPLTDGCWTGFTAAPLVPHGVGILGWIGPPLTLEAVQVSGALWSAAAAVLLGALVARRAGRGAALVATAFFLWSPIVMLRPLIPVAPAHTTFAAALAFLLDCFRRRPGVELAALSGVTLAFAALQPGLVLVVPLFGLAFAAVARRRRALLATGFAFFLVAAFPGATRFPQMLETARSLAGGRAAWAVVDAGYRGRLAPGLAEASGRASLGGPASDLAAGLAPSPVQVARASTRLWGDTVFEPLGAALALVATLAALAGRTGGEVRFLVAFTVLAMVPGLASSYDRVMPARVEMIVPLSLLAGAGWSLLGGAGRPPAALSAAAAAAVVASGAWIFDVVQPRILAPSAAGLARRATVGLDGSAALSRHVLFGLPEGDLPLVFGSEDASQGAVEWDVRRPPDPGLPAAVLLWTPGEQMDSPVAKRVCDAIPGVSLWEVRSLHGDTRLFAALREGRRPPASPEARWIARSCDVPLETDATEATRRLEAARRHAVEGRRDEAIATLEEATSALIAQPRLYLPLARLLSERGGAADLEEAAHWARLACGMSDGADHAACLFQPGARDR